MSFWSFIKSLIVVEAKDVPKQIRAFGFFFIFLAIIAPLASWYMGVTLHDRYVNTEISLHELELENSSSIEKIRQIQNLRYRDAYNFMKNSLDYVPIFIFSGLFCIFLGNWLEFGRNKKKKSVSKTKTKNLRVLRSLGLALLIPVTWFGEKWFNTVSAWHFPFDLLGYIGITLYLFMTIYLFIGDLLEHI
jgi:hypothetical protein